MVVLDDLSEVRPIDVGVDLGRRDVCVTEEILDDTKVGAADQEVGGKRVAERVWMNVFEACNSGVLSDELPNSNAFKWAAAET